MNISQVNSVSDNVLWFRFDTKSRNLYNMILGFVSISPEYSSVHCNEEIHNILENEIASFKQQFP